LRPAWTEQDIADIASEDEGNNPYDQATREGMQIMTFIPCWVSPLACTNLLKIKRFCCCMHIMI